MKLLETNYRKTRSAYVDKDGAIHLDCNTCSNIKPLDDFYNDTRIKFYGKTSQCKECKDVVKKQWAEDNKEKRSELNREWRKKNHDKVLEKNRKWKKDNWDKVLEGNRDWYRRNKEERNIQIVEWQKDNPEKYAEYMARSQHKRRAMKKDLPSTLTYEQIEMILDYQGGRCYLSESERISLEHFIPLSWGIVGDTFENCYYMDLSLNSSKGNKNPFEWIKTQSEAYQERFYNELVPDLASRNGMTVEAFINYVYECEREFA